MTKDLTKKDLEKQIIRGIIDTENPKVFTGKGNRHFMENWDWYQGVALFGLYQYYRDTQDKQVLDYLFGWFDSHIAQGLPMKNINSMCPLLTLSYLYEQTGKQEYRKICQEWADYALHQFPRTPEGGFQHLTITAENYLQLWDDTLYMTVLFLARWGKVTKDETLIQETIRQYLVHLKYLTDVKTGLFFHGFTFDGMHHFAEALWGRGNSWYTAGIVDYLEIVPDLPVGVRDFLISSLRRQADALLRYQDPEGMWHTLINEPESSYREASATAGFAYGLLKAIRMGYLDSTYEPAALKACEAIRALIDEDGILQEVSAGTCLLDTLEEYRTIPLNAQPYGQSMALLLWNEYKKHNS